MNRQMKRAQQRQGATPEREVAPASARRAASTERRRGSRTFLKEVRQELKKVLWPTRSELVTYTIVVLVTVVVLTSFVFALDVVFSKVVLSLFTNG